MSQQMEFSESSHERSGILLVNMKEFPTTITMTILAVLKGRNSLDIFWVVRLEQVSG